MQSFAGKSTVYRTLEKTEEEMEGALWQIRFYDGIWRELTQYCVQSWAVVSAYGGRHNILTPLPSY